MERKVGMKHPLLVVTYSLALHSTCWMLTFVLRPYIPPYHHDLVVAHDYHVQRPKFSKEWHGSVDLTITRLHRLIWFDKDG